MSDEQTKQIWHEEQKIWLWRNGDHFLAYAHEYPCYPDGGDPLVLGEPVGYAILKASAGPAAMLAEQSSMSEMVERVARALDTQFYEHPRWPGEEWQWHEFARAAIAAMREPTEAMFDAGIEVLPPEICVPHVPERCWQAMIDAALKEDAA